MIMCGGTAVITGLICVLIFGIFCAITSVMMISDHYRSILLGLSSNRTIDVLKEILGEAQGETFVMDFAEALTEGFGGSLEELSLQILS